VTNANALMAIVAAAGVTWLLRVLFIALIPGDRLPRSVRRSLAVAGPAAMAALVVVAVVGVRTPGGAPPWRHLAAVTVAAVAARCGANLGVVVVVAILAAGVISAIGL
jgi:branched-subunit amino acid transport protein